MQVTITVKDALIKEAIANTLENSIYEYYEAAVVKAAGVPKKTAFVKQIFEDAKFQAQLNKSIARYVENEITDMIYDEMYDIDLPQVSEMTNACEAAYDRCEEEAAEQRKAEEVKRMVKTLESAGFKIVRA